MSSKQKFIEELEVSVRTTNALTNQGVTTVDQLCVMTSAQVRALEGIGSTSLKEITDVLVEEGRQLSKPERQTEPKRYIPARQAKAAAAFLTGTTLQKISDEFGVSVTRARQLKEAGLTKARYGAGLSGASGDDLVFQDGTTARERNVMRAFRREIANGERHDLRKRFIDGKIELWAKN